MSATARRSLLRLLASLSAAAAMGCGAAAVEAPILSTPTDAVLPSNDVPSVWEIRDAETDEELATLRAFVELHPDTALAALAWLRIGFLEEERDHHEVAERAFLTVACPQQAISGVLDPARRDACHPRVVPALAVEAWHGLASVYGSRGEPAVVLAASEMVLRVAASDDPRLPIYRSLHALALRNVMRFADAIEVYASLAEEGRDDGSDYQIAILIANRDWDDDLEDDPVKPIERPEVQRFLDAHAGLAGEVLWWVGDQLIDRGDTSDGIDALEELIRRAPSHPRAVEAQARLIEARRL